MGGRPLTALNIMGIPTETAAAYRRDPSRGMAKAKEAGCAMVGGHTIRNPEPVCGLAITGLVSPRRMITNAAARPGDLLILTKPLGTGIVTTGIKRGITSPALARRAIRSMRQLNSIGADWPSGPRVRWPRATGFGLLGHLGAMCRASGVGAENRCKISLIAGPGIIRVNRERLHSGRQPANQETTANAITDWGIGNGPARFYSQTRRRAVACFCVSQEEASRFVRGSCCKDTVLCP